MNTRYDTCDVCAADETCALVGTAKVCGDCGNEIADAAGAEGGKLRTLRKERDDAQSEAEYAKEDLREMREKLKRTEAMEHDANIALRDQERRSDELADENDRLRKRLGLSMVDAVPA